MNNTELKYFVISDIHGYYNEMITALKKAGFRKSNGQHILIICGDIFDRGPDAVKVYKYIKSLPKSRRVLIRGNHEYLLREAMLRGSFYHHDVVNGTQDTVDQFIKYYYPSLQDADSFTKCQSFLNLGINRWIASDEWCNYYRLGNYIFVHSWIPLSYQRNKWGDILSRAYNKNWEKADAYQWELATWECPWRCALEGAFPQKQIIVCGHWHTPDFRKYLLHDENSSDFSIFYSKNLIAIDGCTALTHRCNVLVLNHQYKVEK